MLWVTCPLEILENLQRLYVTFLKHTKKTAAKKDGLFTFAENFSDILREMLPKL